VFYKSNHRTNIFSTLSWSTSGLEFGHRSLSEDISTPHGTLNEGLRYLAIIHLYLGNV
jgi:hypothetical protein